MFLSLLYHYDCEKIISYMINDNITHIRYVNIFALPIIIELKQKHSLLLQIIKLSRISRRYLTINKVKSIILYW